MANETILLVEDETDLLLNNKEYLEKQGYGIMTAETLQDASETLQAARIDLIVLDVNMPDGSGFDYIRKLRETSDVPVIFLTCRTDKKDMLYGLKSGGCDYITKPYDLDVLDARIEAQLRQRINDAPLCIGTLEISYTPRMALLDGQNLLLTPKEYSVLEYLARNRHRYVTAKELYTKVWGMEAVDTRPIKQHIRTIREKLGDNGPVVIDSEQGKGYRLKQMQP